VTRYEALENRIDALEARIDQLMGKPRGEISKYEYGLAWQKKDMATVRQYLEQERRPPAKYPQIPASSPDLEQRPVVGRGGLHDAPH